MKQKVLFLLGQNKVVRFGALRRGVLGISEKMLIQRLKELEKDGLVNRKVYRQVPPKVEYSLTDIGKSIVPGTFCTVTIYCGGGKIKKAWHS